MTKLKCPNCKSRDTLKAFDDETLICSHCNRTALIQKKNGKIISISMPGVFGALGAVASVIAILRFFDVDNWDDLTSAIDDLLSNV